MNYRPIEIGKSNRIDSYLCEVKNKNFTTRLFLNVLKYFFINFVQITSIQ